MYAINVTQNVLVGLGIVRVPHTNTMSGSGIERMVADWIYNKSKELLIILLNYCFYISISIFYLHL